jgi:NAD(P)-dependent dehydrogenase (short-subunit alcohol dehydrogenase family)
LDAFRRVLEVNLVAPTYWALEMIGRIAEDRFAKKFKRWEPEEHVQGTVIFIGSVSSHGNRGQVAYAATKAGLEGVAATLTKEAMYHGVRCGVIHPGYTDTPMVRGLGEEYIRERILPQTQLRRLIRTDEIADAICFLISNSAVSGQLWADAGWHAPVA